MKTLIIGHGRNYVKGLDTRCSPIDVNEWFDNPYDCVDAYEDCKPDFVCCIGRRRWDFAKDNSYDRIIDCTGGALSKSYCYSGRDINEYLLEEYKRVLCPGGVVYTDLRVNFILKKSSDGILEKIDKRQKPGTHFYEVI